MTLRPFIVVVALALGGCSGDNAAVITVTGSVANVLHLDLHVQTHNQQHKQTITVPPMDAMPLVFPKTISITFPSGVGNYLDACVEGKMGATVLGKGNGFAQVVEAGVTEMTVPLLTDSTPCGM